MSFNWNARKERMFLEDFVSYGKKLYIIFDL
jgi:hypothetical protein